MISSHSKLVFTFTIYHTLSLKDNHLIRSERNITDTVERGGYHQICCTPQRTVLKYWFLFFQCRCVYFWVATGILKAESVDKKFWNRWFTDEGIRRLCRQTRKARDHHTGGEITTSWKPGLYIYIYQRSASNALGTTWKISFASFAQKDVFVPPTRCPLHKKLFLLVENNIGRGEEGD